MITATPRPKCKIDAYLVTFITDDGEKFRKFFLPTEVDHMRQIIDRLKINNHCLSIKISILTNVVSLERGSTEDPFNYTRRFNGTTKISTISDINKIFKPTE